MEIDIQYGLLNTVVIDKIKRTDLQPI